METGTDPSLCLGGGTRHSSRCENRSPSSSILKRRKKAIGLRRPRRLRGAAAGAPGIDATLMRLSRAPSRGKVGGIHETGQERDFGELGGTAGWARTSDLRIHNPALYQLSYGCTLWRNLEAKPRRFKDKRTPVRRGFRSPREVSIPSLPPYSSANSKALRRSPNWVRIPGRRSSPKRFEMKARIEVVS